MQPYLEMRSIDKIYETYGSQVSALRGANLAVRKGKVHGLLGENGAGKSTLMKILSGVEHMNGGCILLNGEELRIRNASDALALHIGMVHQHFSLIDGFTVLENVVLGSEPSRLGVLDDKSAREKVSGVITRCGFEMDMDETVGRLSMGQKQKVEILRVLYQNAEILIFDEPTSVLVEQEVDSLLDTIRMLRDQGKTIIYISHKVEEVMDITDEVTVLRAGQTVHTGPTKGLDAEAMVSLMVGKHIPTEVERTPHAAGEEVLNVKNLWVKAGALDRTRGVSFSLHAGEILAVAGINGNGQQEMVEAIFGLRVPSAGQVLLNGKDLTKDNPLRHRRAGMGYIPEDRISVGSCSNATISENLVVDKYARPPYIRHSWLDWKEIDRMAATLINKYKIKVNGPYDYAGSMSGGHTQRTIIARELFDDPQVLLACEITMGLDVESVNYIHNLLLEMRGRNRAVLLVSSNLSEILSLADRILVIHQGEMTACLNNGPDVTKSLVGEYMLGLRSQYKAESREMKAVK